MKHLLLYCRPGFEGECAQEIEVRAAEREVYGFARVKGNTGYVLFECYEPGDSAKLLNQLPVNKLIFARQMIRVAPQVLEMSTDDRLNPLYMAAAEDLPECGQLWVESLDTNEGKELNRLCRSIATPMKAFFKKAGKLTAKDSSDKPVLHVCFTGTDSAFIGYSQPKNHYPHLMGIMRLKFPKDAPSRSTLKLEEAFHYFLSKTQREKRLESGMNAVDLGAAPGGWTYQLVQKGMMVTAIDNGPMDQKLLDTGQVKHIRDDGFRWLPKKHNVHWLVCDMIESPKRVANLMCDWFIDEWCIEAIFNLKLPVKRRFHTVEECLELIYERLDKAGVPYRLAAKHLYYDREEITVHLSRK
ncbi:23S rRNA (cytidine(2498)-2'-O)-methyltransferase RlmM [Gallaecimonas pentaromativorans]|uniref:Ribosomal RNA large subunit methyltransferase M n=1 Tax=Gallaecimonas pentaromativorans TaxID=584787 RepID=A0A3N1PL03_9GAMM|nr:23S rRNA (cytidine(2498)-2'-O)-methyltransferase RlmM [Gallaecimonas pentaromativorans]ROQ28548.1 23S rRNA (cytidine2498-2'-O)-methyltransferase [Gallaecimonas pentaromativorans]